MSTDRPQQHSALDARDDLLAIAEAWPDLMARLGRDGARAPDGMPKPVSRTTGLVINETVSETMAEVRDWVMFLIRQLMDETVDTDGRPWAPPAGADVPALLTLVARERLGHFTAHPDEMLRLAFATDAKEMRGKVTRAAYPDGYRTLDTRLPCEDHDTTEAGERGTCPGTYHVRPRSDGAMPDLVCSADAAHRIKPDVWSRSRWRDVHTAGAA